MNHSKSQEDIYLAATEIEQLRDEIKRLRDEVEQWKQARADTMEAAIVKRREAERKVEQLHDEIKWLLARAAQLEGLLIDARDNGLIYWDPVTERGAIERSKMMSRIDVALTQKKFTL